MSTLIKNEPAKPSLKEVAGTGNQQVDQLLALLVAKLSPEEIDELDAMITPRTADLLAKAYGDEFRQLLTPFTEHDQEENSNNPKKTGDTETKKQDVQDVKELMRDPRYWRERDPAVIKKVTESFQKLYP